MNTSKTKLIVLWLSAIALSGCQHTHKEVPVANYPTRPRLMTEASVYVPIPPDGHFKKDLVVDSGKLTAVIVRDAFAKYVKRAYIGRRIESFDGSLKTAQDNNCRYLVYATVVLWENHSTEFSGRTDKVEIKIEVADSVSGEILHATTLRGRSRLFTGGGDSPQDLLQEPIQSYAASLFQIVHVPSALQ